MALRGVTKNPSSHLKQLDENRNAGILLHLTSLPSAFGIGDFGPEAKSFVDFLSRCKQRYWQLLPLNPVAKEQSYSPYSSSSSMAGNILLISPEQLVFDGLITQTDLNEHYIYPGAEANFEEAYRAREILLQKAAKNFFKRTSSSSAFRTFCTRERYWLTDFAIYNALKQYYNNIPWFQWPKELRLRKVEAVKKFSKEAQESIRSTMWQQFIFFRQWNELKSYANKSGIRFIGDLPFYVSYDSADVWANTEIFNVDKNGNMTGVAGVPPDYFNSNGQLWGMPTFRWNVLKSMKYDWWVKRIFKNMEMFDLLRLDHFRAFADYWEVPAGEVTAVRGKWKPGPGKDFFNTLQKQMGALPFIAEDLGDVNDAVFELRDDFNLPGMKILQFAFGDSMPSSAYSPHNYTTNFIVYTGTHDNNTTVGWFNEDIASKAKRQLNSYIGKVVDERNIHIEMSRLAYASVCKTAILPLQDIVGLDARARMNTPASTTNNWKWRFKPGALTKKIERRLRDWVMLYNRSS